MPGGGQEAMKAEIQALLQQVSGELKQLQAQLAQAQGNTAPEAGPGTDPDLYEAPTPLPEGDGSPLPMSLRTDGEKSSATRPASGTGRPDADVSSEAPTVKSEDAQLSDTPLEEKSVDRQTVPPEYRDAFDRLRAQ